MDSWFPSIILSSPCYFWTVAVATQLRSSSDSCFSFSLSFLCFFFFKKKMNCYSSGVLQFLNKGDGSRKWAGFIPTVQRGLESDFLEQQLSIFLHIFFLKSTFLLIEVGFFVWWLTECWTSLLLCSEIGSVLTYLFPKRSQWEKLAWRMRSIYLSPSSSLPLLSVKGGRCCLELKLPHEAHLRLKTQA